MLLWFRTWRRKRLVSKYEREFGNTYHFHGVDVEIPNDISVNLKNALLKQKYESQERDFIEAYLPKDSDVIELGGSVGVVSTYTRSRMSLDARQIVVEALPDLAAICRRNIAKQDPNGRSTVVQAAVSYSGEKSIRFMVGDTPHVGRIAQSEGNTVEVPVVQLEQICSDHDINEFTFICDIEGAEVELFQKSEIWKTACSVIILETHPQFYVNGTQTQESLLKEIKEAGFNELAENDGVYAFGKRPLKVFVSERDVN